MTKKVMDTETSNAIAGNLKASTLKAVRLERAGEALSSSDARYESFKTPGIFLIGTLRLRQVGRGKYKSTVYEMDTANGKVFFYGSTMLDRCLENIKVNDMLFIKYLGEKTSTSTGSTYENYEVYRIPEPEGFDINVHLPIFNPDNGEVSFVERV